MTRALPSGWVHTTLGDLATSMRNGIFVSRPTDGPVGAPILRIAAVRPGRLDLTDRKYVQDMPERQATSYTLMEGDLLFTRYSGSRHLVGACARVPGHEGPLLHPDKLIRVTVPEQVADSRFLARLMESRPVRDHLEQNTRTTAGQSGIARGAVRSIPVVLPPRPEQTRIADRLDELLDELDRAEGNAARLLSRLCQVQTRLVDAALAPYARQAEPLRDVLEEPLANGRSVRTRSGGFPVLRLTAIRDGQVDLDETKEGDWTSADAATWQVRAGDFLIVRGNGSLRLVGRGGLVPRAPKAVAYPDTLIRVRVDRDRCRPEYLRLVWGSSGVRKQLEGLARTTAGIYKINQQHLNAIVLPLPSVAVQDQLVARMAAAETSLSIVLRQAGKMSSRLMALRASVIRSAVDGQLAPQDPADGHAGQLLLEADSARAKREFSAARGRADTMPQTHPKQRAHIRAAEGAEENE